MLKVFQKPTDSELARRLEIAENTNRVLRAEIDELSAVIARNRKRVEAETAIAARQIADAENAGGLVLK